MAVELKQTNYEKVMRLIRAFRKAESNNPYQAATRSANDPTMTITAATDATLGPAVLLTNGTLAMSSAGLNQVAWYGGVPKANGKYVHTPVASQAPSTGGNLSGYVNANITGDMNEWCASLEITTDGTSVELGLFMNSAMRAMVQVDGYYVDKVGMVGAQAGGGDNFIKLVFPTRKRRVIRFMWGIRAGSASGPMPFQIRVSPTCNFWKPDQSGVLKMLWFGDSYGEAQPTAFQIPNGPMALIAGELLGIRDVRQTSVGQTGYMNNGGTRSALRDQITAIMTTGNPLYQGPGDLITIAHGYNDYSWGAYSAATLTAEALYCYQLMRSFTSAPIVVLGCQAGKRGPDAKTIEIENAISAAVTQFNDPLCRFAPVSTDFVPWLNGTGYIGATNGTGNSDVYIAPDATHPSDPGHENEGYRASSGIWSAVQAMAA